MYHTTPILTLQQQSQQWQCDAAVQHITAEQLSDSPDWPGCKACMTLPCTWAACADAAAIRARCDVIATEIARLTGTTDNIHTAAATAAATTVATAIATATASGTHSAALTGAIVPVASVLPAAAAAAAAAAAVTSAATTTTAIQLANGESPAKRLSNGFANSSSSRHNNNNTNSRNNRRKRSSGGTLSAQADADADAVADVVQCTLSLSALRGGSAQQPRRDALAELRWESAELARHLELAELDRELHGAWATDRQAVEVTSLHKYATVMWRADARRALGSAREAVIARTVAVEIVDDLLEGLLEGWTFAERPSEHPAAGYVPSFKGSGVLRPGDQRRAGV
jgi:hypothetical protein